MPCKECGCPGCSTQFNAEMGIHFPGRDGLNKPLVLVFSQLIVCLRCGFTEFTIPERELRVLEQGASGEALARDRVATERRKEVLEVEIKRRHEAVFYSDERSLLAEVTQFVGTALKVGNAAIVVATESHRNNLVPMLRAYGLDIGAAIEQRRYIALDAADALSTFVVNGMPDTVRFMQAFDNLIATAAKAAKGGQPGVAFFGEGSHLLWAQGDAEAAIQTEKISNQLTKQHDVDILSGYFLGGVQGGMDKHIYQRICVEHSAVHCQ